MAKIGVGGGAGFIGSHLVDNLVRNGHSVFVIDDLSGGNEDNLNQKAKFYKGDCRYWNLMDEIFESEKPEVFFCLQANAAENKSVFSPIDITSRNYSAFINTLTPFIKYGGKRFVFTSSIAVYGAQQTPFKEDAKPEPEDLYGVTKLAAEQTLEVMSKVHGFEYIITRPHNVYGPRQNMTDPYRNVVTIWMNALLQGKSYFIYGDGSMKRCFSYIDDVIEALYKCIDIPTKNWTFNIGADTSYTLNELAQVLQRVTGIKQKPIYLPKRAQEVQEAIADHTKAKLFLKYKDSVSLQTGMKNTWEWAKKQGPQEPIKTGFEIMSDKIPSNWL